MTNSVPHRYDLEGSILYHYTSAASLLKIVKSRRLWASDIHFLNDAREFEHGKAVATELISAFLVKPAALVDHSVGKMLLQSLETVTKHSVYVFSLSEDGDLLSQWRGYCPSGNGYALGFDTKALVEVASAQGFQLVKCVYDKQDQDSAMTYLVNKAMGAGRRKIPAEATALLFQSEFFQLAPALKDPSFREEQEWRLITPPSALDFPGIDFHLNGTLVPHRELDIENLPIAEVVIGPNPRMDLARRSLSHLFAGLQPGPKIRESLIPYRPG